MHAIWSNLQLRTCSALDFFGTWSLRKLLPSILFPMTIDYKCLVIVSKHCRNHPISKDNLVNNNHKIERWALFFSFIPWILIWPLFAFPLYWCRWILIALFIRSLLFILSSCTRPYLAKLMIFFFLERSDLFTYKIGSPSSSRSSTDPKKHSWSQNVAG